MEEYKCERCNGKLELIPELEPWHTDYWICEDCDSTYYFTQADKGQVMDNKEIDEYLKKCFDPENQEIFRSWKKSVILNSIQPERASGMDNRDVVCGAPTTPTKGSEPTGN